MVSRFGFSIHLLPVVGSSTSSLSLKTTLPANHEKCLQRNRIIQPCGIKGVQRMAEASFHRSRSVSKNKRNLFKPVLPPELYYSSSVICGCSACVVRSY